jgi:BirA family biotin operon repressor/biotin-[acetyl-CoA-carboxylase] ligase
MAFDVERVRRQLAPRLVRWHDSVGSTMIEAARLAREDFPSGTIVGADEQQTGQGRYGRRWHSEPEAGLYVTFLLRPSLPLESLPAATLAIGLAAREAVLNVCGLACDLRWPNDLLAASRKCAGILLQLDQGALLAGIGINVNQRAFPDELAVIATSLRLASGKEHSREEILLELAPAIDRYLGLLAEAGNEPILRLFSEISSYAAGRRVVVQQDQETLTGTTEGLDASGFLIVRTDDGKRSIILAGGVRPA